MKRAIVFPGQGAQYVGAGNDIKQRLTESDAFFAEASEILGYDVGDFMCHGDAEALRHTKVTQPAIYLHSVADYLASDSPQATAVAGHSLGEFSALYAAGAYTWQDGLRLVRERAFAMQDACDDLPGTMAAILGMEDGDVEQLCQSIDGVVVAANYNCPSQLVISGAVEAIGEACEKAKEAGAKRALPLPVGGAFHSPLMQSAQDRLSQAIDATNFSAVRCPIYQNVSALPSTDLEVIKDNLKAQLTGAVRWTQSVQAMIGDGIDHFHECGGIGKVLSGLIRKIDRSVTTAKLIDQDG